MLPRFFAPALADRDDPVAPIALPPDEARHLTRVLRLQAGAEVALFDGRGREFVAIVHEAVRERAIVKPVRRIEPAAEPHVRFTLVQALLKADKLDAIIRDTTMMGVSAIRPAVTLRGNTSLAAARRPAAVERWRRIAVSSAKQCGRAVVPEIEPAADLEVIFAADVSAARLILAEPQLVASGGTDVRQLQQHPWPASATVVIGPEGGWHPREIECARRHGFAPLTLGRRTLRADAAPLVVISVLQTIWGEF